MTAEPQPAATDPVNDKAARLDRAKRFAIASARLMADRNSADVVALDLGGRSPVADMLVIGTGTSDRQMKSVADEIEEIAPESGHAIVRRSEDSRCTWIVSDYGDVVVHLFEPNTRAFYDLELLWGDAERVEWKREAGSAAS